MIDLKLVLNLYAAIVKRFLYKVTEKLGKTWFPVNHSDFTLTLQIIAERHLKKNFYYDALVSIQLQ